MKLANTDTYVQPDVDFHQTSVVYYSRLVRRLFGPPDEPYKGYSDMTDSNECAAPTLSGTVTVPCLHQDKRVPRDLNCEHDLEAQGKAWMLKLDASCGRPHTLT